MHELGSGFNFSSETGFPVLAGNEKFPEFRNFQDFPIENDLKFKFRISTFSDRISVFSDRKILLGSEIVKSVRKN